MSKRAPRPTPGKLKLKWGKMAHSEPDICVSWGEGCSKADSRLLFWVLCSERFKPGSFEQHPSLVDELRQRGYDITTIQFSIEKLKPE